MSEADVLDAIIDRTDQRRAERDAADEQAAILQAARARTCDRCGSAESWLAPGRPGWHTDNGRDVCHPCWLDAGMVAEGLVGSVELRARAIRQVLGTLPTPSGPGTARCRPGTSGSDAARVLAPKRH